MALLSLRQPVLDAPPAVLPLTLEEGVAKQCPWCGRVKRGGDYQGPSLPTIQVLEGHGVSHGICPECNDRLRAENGLPSRN